MWSLKFDLLIKRVDINASELFLLFSFRLRNAREHRRTAGGQCLVPGTPIGLRTQHVNELQCNESTAQRCSKKEQEDR